MSELVDYRKQRQEEYERRCHDEMLQEDEELAIREQQAENSCAVGDIQDDLAYARQLHEELNESTPGDSRMDTDMDPYRDTHRDTHRDTSDDGVRAPMRTGYNETLMQRTSDGDLDFSEQDQRLLGHYSHPSFSPGLRNLDTVQGRNVFGYNSRELYPNTFRVSIVSCGTLIGCLFVIYILYISIHGR
eukprot:GHVR01011944.1.p1 GENE.GHVR01011944.1~~GHVR01011944.1.p1  ORF type:complete len:188 (+),score=29.04 GHVR01011944.1:27-590(+)